MRDIVEFFRLTPENTCLETLSPMESASLVQVSKTGVHSLLMRCSLAVLNSGAESDDVQNMLSTYHDFDLNVKSNAGGIELELFNVPGRAFVTYEGRDRGRPVLSHKIVEGLRQHLFAVVRDLVFAQNEVVDNERLNLSTGQGTTEAVFHILRNAGIFSKTGRHKVVSCWGGHAVNRDEYHYSLQIGNQCGLRFMDIITGCGPGVMRGPMEGAAIGHAKQRVTDGRYIGLTEPGIIASEAPNPIVNPLVIMPNIEMRLEAFVRLAQGLIIFPGGVGTMEEICYILGLLMNPANHDLPFPVILTGPEESQAYWERIDHFLKAVFGRAGSTRYQIIIDDPEKVAREINKGLLEVKFFRDSVQDSYYFNTRLHIPWLFQEHFAASHESVEQIKLKKDMEPHLLAGMLRRIFSAIVTGNVRPEGLKAIAEKGPYVIHGDRVIIDNLKEVLADISAQKRMSLKPDHMPKYVATD